MNLKRGFFRLWILLSAIFVIAVGIFSYENVKNSFDKQIALNRVIALLMPIQCEGARGIKNEDYNIYETVSETSKDEKSKILCWYELPKFRKLYAEYNDIKDADLKRRLYEKVGLPITPDPSPVPWFLLLQLIALALGAPLILLGIGAIVGWVFSGFKNKSTPN